MVLLFEYGGVAMETAKDEVLMSEGDHYFKRNMIKEQKIEVAEGCRLLGEF